MLKSGKRTIILLIIALVTVVGITFAWSVEIKQSQLNNITIETISGGSIELSTSPDSGWGSDITIEFDGSAMTDCSGDGFDFYTPILDPISKEPVYGGDNWSAAKEGSDYVTFELYVRSTSNMHIFLDESSSIQPNTDKRYYDDGKTSDLENPNQISNKSEYGYFTKDYIAAATRLAAYSEKINQEENASTLKETMDLAYIWVPNSTYELLSDNNTLSFTENGTVEYEYYYEDEDGVGHIVSYDGNPTTYAGIEGAKDVTYASYVKNTNGIYTSDFLDSDIFITEIKASTSNYNGDTAIGKIEGVTSGSLGVTKISFAIWIDGNDRESSAALAGGIISINLFFSGVQLYSEPVTLTYDETTETISNVTTEMEYSLDNGETYTQITTSNVNDGLASVISNANTVDYYKDQIYIRYITTQNGLPSNYAVIDLS